MIGSATEAVTKMIPFFSGESGADEYQKAKNAIGQFKEAFACLAQELFESEPRKPLIIMIDELDRCRPSYAIELLEMAKHLFSVDHVIFVLAVNRTELAHSVKAMYGSGFDAEGYLRRFIDLDFQLPAPDRERFVTELLQTTSLARYLADGFNRGEETRELKAAKNLLKVFLGSSDLSLRRVQQAAHRLGLIFSLLAEGSPLHALTAVLAIVLRTVNFKVYHNFLLEQVTDKDVADAVFSLQGMKSLPQSEDNKWFRIDIEGHIILSMLPTTVDCKAGKRDIDKIESPLLLKYGELENIERQMKSDGTAGGTNPYNSYEYYATDLLRHMRDLQKFPRIRQMELVRSKFIASIQNLEMLSSDLAKEAP